MFREHHSISDVVRAAAPLPTIAGGVGRALSGAVAATVGQVARRARLSDRVYNTGRGDRVQKRRFT